ncbi:MAG: hypothetical protein GY777_22235, partial [Candidatus Brocadiaceae bacterium]|nr:hypothetical protein [Candidatus Brocadiaceae bacterium]
DGTWTLEYTITATNSGTGPGVYDIVDDFHPGAGITLSGATISYGTGETNNTSTADNTPVTDEVAVVVNESLLAGGSETWVITAVFTVDPVNVTATSGDCTDDLGENGATGFANSVSGSLTDNDSTNDDACVPLDGPSIDLAKTAGTPVDNGDGTWTLEYTITATNSGTGPGVYDIVDDFHPGAGITLSGATISYGTGET